MKSILVIDDMCSDAADIQREFKEVSVVYSHSIMRGAEILLNYPKFDLFLLDMGGTNSIENDFAEEVTKFKLTDFQLVSGINKESFLGSVICKGPDLYQFISKKLGVPWNN